MIILMSLYLTENNKKNKIKVVYYIIIKIAVIIYGLNNLLSNSTSYLSCDM